MAAYSIAIRLFIFLAATVPADLDTILCDGTEVCLLPFDAVEPYNISCNCHSSIHCYWTTLADRRKITNGTTESLLVWHSNTRGYGQFTCISQDTDSSDHVERNVLIIPNVQRMSCDGCISTTICTTTTGKCRLRFSKLFNVSSQCELHVDFLNGTRNVNTFTEGKYMNLLPNSSYYIQCHTPTCPDINRDIYYIIPTSIVEDCSNSDLCSQPPTTAATMSTFSVSVSSTPPPTHSESLVSITASSTMIPALDVSNGNDDNDDDNVGAIIGGIITGVLFILMIIIMICIALLCCYYNNRYKDNDELIKDGPIRPTDVPATTPPSLPMGPPTYIIYSEEHSDFVHQLSDLLICCGVDCDIDQYHMIENIPQWGVWNEDKIKKIAKCNGFVLLMCCPKMHQQLSDTNVSSQIQMKVGHINTFALNTLIREEATTHCIIPVCLCETLEKLNIKIVPDSLRGRTIYSLSLSILEQVEPEADILNKPGLESLQSLVFRLNGKPEISKPIATLGGQEDT